MSVWTHVAGIIRIDDIRIGNTLPDFDKLIGKECQWESPIEIWDDTNINPQNYLPMGSEGSLEKSVWINPDKSCMSSYTVSIFGDLRDYENSENIIEWFKNKINEINEIKGVRQAVIISETEGKEPLSWHYNT